MYTPLCITHLNNSRRLGVQENHNKHAQTRGLKENETERNFLRLVRVVFCLCFAWSPSPSLVYDYCSGDTERGVVVVMFHEYMFICIFYRQQNWSKYLMSCWRVCTFEDSAICHHFHEIGLVRFFMHFVFICVYSPHYSSYDSFPNFRAWTRTCQIIVRKEYDTKKRRRKSVKILIIKIRNKKIQCCCNFMLVILRLIHPSINHFRNSFRSLRLLFFFG